jgi:hypothetical protein
MRDLVHGWFWAASRPFVYVTDTRDVIAREGGADARNELTGEASDAKLRVVDGSCCEERSVGVGAGEMQR